MSFLKLISQAFPRPLPQFRSFFPAMSLAIFFARALLSERLEQAKNLRTILTETFHVITTAFHMHNID